MVSLDEAGHTSSHRQRRPSTSAGLESLCKYLWPHRAALLQADRAGVWWVPPGFSPFLPSFPALLFPVLLSPAGVPFPSQPHRRGVCSEEADRDGRGGRGAKGWGVPVGTPGGVPFSLSWPPPFLHRQVKCAQQISSGCKLLTSKGHSAQFPRLPSGTRVITLEEPVIQPLHLLNNDGCVFPAFLFTRAGHP